MVLVRYLLYLQYPPFLLCHRPLTDQRRKTDKNVNEPAAVGRAVLYIDNHREILFINAPRYLRPAGYLLNLSDVPSLFQTLFESAKYVPFCSMSSNGRLSLRFLRASADIEYF
jgi:hypothetical protein